MKLYCQYSGINFTLPHLQTARVSTLTVHPAFHMNRAQLYHLYSDWQEGLIEHPNDRRLLFLAILNSTGLIEWQATANPSDAVVNAQMPNLYYTCKWVTAVTLPAMKLPRFAVTKDTRSLENIGEWLKVWEQIRTDFEAGYRTMSQIEKQKEREVMLERLIKGTADTAKYAGLLSQWAFDAGNVPEGIRSYWRQMLCTKGLGILSLNKTDMEELVEHFEETLAEHGSIYSFTFLSYIRWMQKQIVTGIGFNIKESRDLVDIVIRSEYNIIDADDDSTLTERSNIQKLINSAPTIQPIEADYPTKVAFLRANISWKMAQRSKVAEAEAIDKISQQEEKLEKQLLEDSILNIESEDDDDVAK